MKLKALLGLEKPYEDTAFTLYGSIVAQARQPYFYSDLNVTDTLEGRYEMIIMHAFLLFHRLKGESENATELGQVQGFRPQYARNGCGRYGSGPAN